MHKAFVLFVVVAAASPTLASTVHRIPSASRLSHPRLQAKPNVVENGTNFVTIPFTVPNSFGSIAFTPDGTVHFVGAQNTLSAISPNGTYSQTTVSRAFLCDVVSNQQGACPMTYARGFLWTIASGGGLLKAAPDGSKRHWYPLNGTNFVDGAIVDGPDATYAVGTNIPDPITGANSFAVFRIDDRSLVTETAVPVPPAGAAAFGADGLLYFAYALYDSDAGGIARLEKNGSTTLFPTNADERFSVVRANGSIYFIGTAFDQPYTFGKITPAGVVSKITIPGQGSNPNSLISRLSVDFGANIWMDIGDSQAEQLYQYNTYTSHFNAPEPPTSSNESYEGPYVGPDDNIWSVRNMPPGHAYPFPSSFGVLVRHVQTLEPASLSLTQGQAAPFTILETHFNGPWTAHSLNPAVTAVSPATSPSGAFTATDAGPGVTSIAIADRLGNVSYEFVTGH